MTEAISEIVIPKEMAVFWLDKNGCWHNDNGKFRHKKIIDFFHASIRKDKNGYHLYQENNNCREKVYFRYEDTALFVFDVLKKDNMILILNTGRRMTLSPEKLIIQGDNLYVELEEERAKFSERSLMKISDLLEFENDQYFIKIKARRYKLQALR
jgi:hypothetical protein